MKDTAFPARRDFKNLMPLYLGMAFFLIVGILAFSGFLGKGKSGTLSLIDAKNLGYVMILIFSMLILISLLSYFIWLPKKAKKKVTKKGIVTQFGVLIIFLIIGFLQYFGVLKIDPDRIWSSFGFDFFQTMGIIFISFPVLVIVLSILVFGHFRSYYKLSENSLFISVPGFKVDYPYPEIMKLEKINNEQVSEIMKSNRQSQLDNPLDMFRRDSSTKKIIRLLDYCTVPIQFREFYIRTGKGGFSARIWWKVRKPKTSGDFIMMTTKSGEQFLLSPKNVDGFLQTYDGYSK